MSAVLLVKFKGSIADRYHVATMCLYHEYDIYRHIVCHINILINNDIFIVNIILSFKWIILNTFEDTTYDQ